MIKSILLRKNFYFILNLLFLINFFWATEDYLGHVSPLVIANKKLFNVYYFDNTKEGLNRFIYFVFNPEEKNSNRKLLNNKLAGRIYQWGEINKEYRNRNNKVVTIHLTTNKKNPDLEISITDKRISRKIINFLNHPKLYAIDLTVVNEKIYCLTRHVEKEIGPPLFNFEDDNTFFLKIYDHKNERVMTEIQLKKISYCYNIKSYKERIFFLGVDKGSDYLLFTYDLKNNMLRRYRLISYKEKSESYTFDINKTGLLLAYNIFIEEKKRSVIKTKFFTHDELERLQLLDEKMIK